MTAIKDAKNLQQYKSRFSFTKEQILALVSSTNMVRQVKVSPNFKQIAWQSFTSINILIRVVRSILLLSQNSKQFHQKETQITCT